MDPLLFWYTIHETQIFKHACWLVHTTSAPVLLVNSGFPVNHTTVPFLIVTFPFLITRRVPFLIVSGGHFSLDSRVKDIHYHLCCCIWKPIALVLFGGHVWFYSGGHAWFYWGACVVLFGGACVVLFGGWHAWFHSGGCLSEIHFFSNWWQQHYNINI